MQRLTFIIQISRKMVNLEYENNVKFRYLKCFRTRCPLLRTFITKNNLKKYFFFIIELSFTYN